MPCPTGQREPVVVQVRLPSSLSSEVLQCARYPTEGRWKIKTELLLPCLLVMYNERYYVGLYPKGKDLSNSCPDSSLGMNGSGSTWEDAHSLGAEQCWWWAGAAGCQLRASSAGKPLGHVHRLEFESQASSKKGGRKSFKRVK